MYPQSKDLKSLPRISSSRHGSDVGPTAMPALEHPNPEGVYLRLRRLAKEFRQPLYIRHWSDGGETGPFYQCVACGAECSAPVYYQSGYYWDDRGGRPRKGEWKEAWVSEIPGTSDSDMQSCRRCRRWAADYAAWLWIEKQDRLEGLRLRAMDSGAWIDVPPQSAN